MTQILVVEDNIDILENINLILEAKGFEVRQAIDGQQAIYILRNSDKLPDLILSDISMPNFNGYQLLASCQRNSNWIGIPFIFLTALGERRDVMFGKKLGVDDYLVKPFLPDELIIAINNKLQRINQLNASAEHKLDKTRRELLSLISHELRTPLSTIYGGAELLADSLANVPDSMSHRMLKLVQSGAKRMRRLVDQIVLLTQLESGSLAQSLKTSARTYKLQIIIERAYALLEEEWEPDKPPVSLNFRMPSDPIEVCGNPDFLVMMVQEGVRNAITFSPQDGQVDIELTQDGQNAFIVITDQGAGIAAVDLPRIWQRFVQIDRNKLEQQGLGLGLPLTRESARLHNGDCAIESEIGSGTQFILRLPLSSGSVVE